MRRKLLHMVKQHEDNFTPREVFPQAFEAAVDFRNYRLARRDPMSTSKSMHKARKYITEMRLRLKSKFTGKEPASILRFLSDFADACDSNGIAEGDAVWLFQDFMDGEPSRELKSRIGQPRTVMADMENSLVTYPAVVRHLLETYATDANLQNAYNELRALTMGSNQSAKSFRRALCARADMFGNAFHERVLVECYLNGCVKRYQPAARLHWHNVIKKECRAGAESFGRARLDLLVDYIDSLRVQHGIHEVDGQPSTSSDRKQHQQSKRSTSRNSTSPHRTSSVSIAPIVATQNQASQSTQVQRSQASTYKYAPQTTPAGRSVRFLVLFTIPHGYPDITQNVIDNINNSNYCRFCSAYKFSDDPSIVPHESSDCDVALPSDPIARYKVLATRLQNVKNYQSGSNRSNGNSNRTSNNRSSGRTTHSNRSSQPDRNTTTGSTNQGLRPTPSTSDNQSEGK